MQIPAPLGDQNRGLGQLSDGRISSHEREKIARGLFGTAANHKREPREARRHGCLQDDTVRRDQRDATTLLPKRKWFTFLDFDAQTVGIKLENRGIGDPWIGKQPRTHARSVQEQKRRTIGDTREDQNLVAADFMFARERDLGNVEAKLVGGRIADILDVLNDLRTVSAFDRAVAHACKQQHRGGRRTGPAWHLQVEKRATPPTRKPWPTPTGRFRPQSGRLESFQLQRLSEASPTFHRNLLLLVMARTGLCSTMRMMVLMPRIRL